MSTAFLANGKIYTCSDVQRLYDTAIYNEIPFDNEIMAVFMESDTISTYRDEYGDRRADSIYIIDVNGDSWVRGDNIFSELANLNEPQQREWTKIETETKFKMMAIGLTFIVAIDIDDDLWLIGDPLRRSSDTYPIRIGEGIKFVDISAGRDFFAAVDLNGSIWMLGKKLRSMDNYYDFTEIEKGNFVAVSCGPEHIIALDDNGVVWGKGRVNPGCLGFGVLPVSFIKDFVQITRNCSVQTISAGSAHSLFLTTDNTVFGCGSNTKNQLGPELVPNVSGRYLQIIIDNNNQFSQILAFGDTTLLKDINGNLWVSTVRNNGTFAKIDVKGAIDLPNRKLFEIRMRSRGTRTKSARK